MYSPGVATGDSQDQPAKRLVAHLDEQVHVITHPAIGVYARLKAFDDVGGDPLEKFPVGRDEEDVLAMIASKRYVIERAGHMNAGLAGHPCL
ncbi:MAG TPA: hypothetical protein VLD59_10065 [Steroidobacteraceae bacterium]|nr:hypothetical protein [Steroidobacteraceae bacterium]